MQNTLDIEKPKGFLGSIRYELYRIMFATRDPPLLHIIVDRFIITLTIVSVLAIMLEHVESIHEVFHWEFAQFDKISVLIFTGEYVLRLLCGGLTPRFNGHRFRTIRYVLTPMALLDLLVVVPF